MSRDPQNFLEAKDFDSIIYGHHGATPTIQEMAANIANALIREALGPKVYSEKRMANWRSFKSGHTLQSHLFCTEEIK